MVTNKITAGLPGLGLGLVAIITLASFLPIQPNDYWWYLRLGQDISHTWSIPTIDSYSYTQYGQPMVYHPWLSALLFFLAHQVGSLTLTFFIRNLLLAIFYSCVWACCRLAGAGSGLASLLMVLAALVGSNNWAMRPQLFSFACFGLALLVLWQWQQGKNRWLWLLPLVTIAWVNLHGAFILIFLLAGAAIVGGGGNRTKLLLWFSFMVLASLINPRGIGAWHYVLTLLTDPPSQQLGAEWLPPTNEGWQGILFFGWLLLLIPLAARSSARLTFTQWLWLLGFGWMALSGLRYVIWFLAIIAPISAQLLTPMLKDWLSKFRFDGRYPKVDLIFMIGLLALSLALLPGIRARWWVASPPALSANTPISAVNWLQTHPTPAGPVWADLAFSSYFIYALPNRPVWIDTRFELYPIEHWQAYLTIAEANPGWQSLLNADDVKLLILDPASQPKLIAAVQQEADWDILFQDDTAVVFGRREMDDE